MSKMRPVTHSRGSSGTLHKTGSSREREPSSTLSRRASRSRPAKQRVCVCVCLCVCGAVVLHGYLHP